MRCSELLRASRWLLPAPPIPDHAASAPPSAVAELGGVRPQMNRHDVVHELRALSLPADEYVVVSGGVLAMHGIRDTEDIDLVVSERLFADLQAQGWRAKTRPNGKPGLKRGLIEAYLDVNSESFERSKIWLLGNAQVLDGIPTIDLETLAGFKAGYGRPKDLRDLTLLRERASIELSTGSQSAS